MNDVPASVVRKVGSRAEARSVVAGLYGFTQPVAMSSNDRIASSLPCTSPSWLPNTEYDGTFSPSASNGACARSIRPGYAGQSAYWPAGASGS